MIKIAIALFLMTSTAFATTASITCTSLNPVYEGIPFEGRIFDNEAEAQEAVSKWQGVVIKRDSQWMGIWHGQIAAPNSGYNCYSYEEI